ncbi:MAG: YrhK family protein [Pseudomonadota bacterium]
MSLFDPQNHTRTPQHRKVYAAYELAYTVVVVYAALLFIIGSILFFGEATTYIATWLFVAGSVLFGLRPTTKLLREIHYWRLGQYEEISKSD